MMMSDSRLDTLSPLAHRILQLGAPSSYSRLVVSGEGLTEAREILEIVQPDQLVSVPMANSTDARGMLAGLWLWHDWLDESHRISQELHDSTGSFWHAIMHRREGDFSNSKYWYARVGQHPMLPIIGAAVTEAVNHLPADKSYLRLFTKGWNPNAFVDLVEEVSDNPSDPRLQTVIAIQRVEWRMLFDHCTRSAGQHESRTE